MTILLQGQKKSSGWGSIGAGLGKGLGEGMEIGRQKKEDKSKENKTVQALQEYTGVDTSGWNDDMRKALVNQVSKYKQQQSMIEGLGLDDFGMGGERESETAGLIEPKKPKGILSSEFGGAQGKIEKQPSDEIKVKVPTLIPQDKINKMSLINPSAADKMQRYNDNQQKEARHQELLNKQQEQHREKQEKQEKQFFHTGTQKFDEGLDEQAVAAERKNRALDRQMANVDKLGWYDRIVGTVFAGTGIGDLFRSSTAQEFDANTLPQLEGQRQILGGILSDSDIRLLMQKIVTSSKTPEANKQIAKIFKLENDLTIAKKRIGDEVKARNDGYRPANYKAEVDRIYNERYGQYIKDMQEDIMSLPDDKKKLEKIGRRKVPPGTQISPHMADMYLDLADNDLDKASKMMVEDGYDE